MERADLLYSGLMFAAGMLSVWTALLLTATFVALAPALRKSAPPLLQFHLQEVIAWCRRTYAPSFPI